MTTPAVIAAIHAAIAELKATPSAAPTERVAALLAHVVTVGAEASPDDRKQLLEAVSALQAEVGRALEQLGDDLRRTGASRAAMSGYGAIRPHTTAQRLRTRI